jgi:hypothetical protein
MINGFKMIAQRLATHREAVFDKLRRLAQCQRVAFDGVGGVGQINVIRFLQGSNAARETGRIASSRSFLAAIAVASSSMRSQRYHGQSVFATRAAA